MLYEIEEIGVYCGPAALMAVSGKRLAEVRAAINAAKQRKENTGVCGMYDWELFIAMDNLGLKHHCQKIDFPPHVRTLAKIVEDKNWCLPDRTYIVSLTGHYVAVENGVVMDNRIRFGCSVTEHPSKNKRVHALIEVKVQS
jgi:hypothetical protein